MVEPSAKQKLALNYLTDQKTNFVGYGGAAFGGKSFLLCCWIVTMCLAFPGTGWGIGRRQLTTLYKTTVITLHKVFAMMGLKAGEHYKHDGRLHTYTFTNGSQIFLIDMAYKPSDKEYTRFGGYELTGAAVDESVEVEKMAIEILFTRLGRRLNHEYGLKKKLLETFNPAKNHVYSRYYRRFKEGRMPEQYAFIPALPADNPSPEVEDYIKDIIANASRVTIERLIYGNFDYEDDPNILMDYSARLDLFSNNFVVPKSELFNRYITADIAMQGSDKFVILVWYGWVIVDVVVVPKSGGLDVVQTIKATMKKHRVPASQVCYDHDGVGAFIGGNRGMIPGAVGFVANSSPIKRVSTDKEEKNQYKNLKAQCGYEIAKKVNAREIWWQKQVDNEAQDEIAEDIGQIMKDGKLDGKLGLKPKSLIIRDISRSNDFGDAFLMRYLFELRPKRSGRKVRTIKVNR